MKLSNKQRRKYIPMAPVIREVYIIAPLPTQSTGTFYKCMVLLVGVIVLSLVIFL